MLLGNLGDDGWTPKASNEKENEVPLLQRLRFRRFLLRVVISVVLLYSSVVIHQRVAHYERNVLTMAGDSTHKTRTEVPQVPTAGPTSRPSMSPPSDRLTSPPMATATSVPTDVPTAGLTSSPSMSQKTSPPSDNQNKPPTATPTSIATIAPTSLPKTDEPDRGHQQEDQGSQQPKTLAPSAAPAASAISKNTNIENEILLQYMEESLYKRGTPLHTLFKGPAAPTKNDPNKFPFTVEPDAVCHFREKGAFFHFPHAMQQLLPCFSWWHAPVNKNKTRVLSIRKIPNKDFTRSYIQFLQDHFQIRLEPETYHQNKSVYVEAPAGLSPRDLPYKMYQPHHATLLREGLWDYYNLTGHHHHAQQQHQPEIAGCPADTTNITRTAPVIGFLNRKGSRHVDNHQDIIDAISQHDFGTSIPPIIRYLDSFDGMPFSKQITFMAQVDIVISPHGAQLTSSAFIPTCGGLLEFFPKGYYIPWYFGTLARSTGHYHYIIYTGTITNKTQETKYYMHHTRRDIARSFHITANPEVVLSAVQELTKRWQNCCQRGPRPFGRRRL